MISLIQNGWQSNGVKDAVRAPPSWLPIFITPDTEPRISDNLRRDVSVAHVVQTLVSLSRCDRLVEAEFTRSPTNFDDDYHFPGEYLLVEVRLTNDTGFEKLLSPNPDLQLALIRQTVL
jgi:hypothetical protein